MRVLQSAKGHLLLFYSVLWLQANFCPPIGVFSPELAGSAVKKDYFV